MSQGNNETIIIMPDHRPHSLSSSVYLCMRESHLIILYDPDPDPFPPTVSD